MLMGKRGLRRTPLSRILSCAIRSDSNRRAFLRGGLGAVGAAAAWALSGCATKGGAASVYLPRTQIAPVVILGGGLSGLCAAYRLTRQGVPCVVYEGGPRLGGRIHTHYQFNQDGQFCELGAELVDKSNLALRRLCDELGVQVEEFAKGDRGLQPELLYFGGRHYSHQELLRSLRPLLSSVRKDLALFSPNGAPPLRYHNAASAPKEARRLDQLSLQAYLEEKRDACDELALAVVGAAYKGEYGMELEEQSALNFLLVTDTDLSDGYEPFGVSDESLRIRGGSSTLIAALAQSLRKAVPIHLEHRLIAIAERGSSLRLTFQTPASSSVTVDAKRVICTLPFSTLRLVEGILGLPMRPEKHLAITNLGYGTNSKFMASFESRSWRKPSSVRPASTGSVLTDLPGVEYWETSRLQRGKRGIVTNFIGGKDGLRIGRERLDLMLSDLKKVHAEPLSHDGMITWRCWPQHPLSLGSYSCLRPGQRCAFHGAEGLPELSGRLLFAGEHCSQEWQGLMNGAVESAEEAAKALTLGA